MITTDDRPDCSACGGAWLYGLTHKHRTSCRRYEPETATAVADHDRGHGVRNPTPTEEEQISEHGYEEAAAGERHLIEFSHRGIHQRWVLIGADPDDGYHRDARRGHDQLGE